MSFRTLAPVPEQSAIPPTAAPVSEHRNDTFHLTDKVGGFPLTMEPDTPQLSQSLAPQLPFQLTMPYGRPPHPTCREFALNEVKAATNNFSQANLLGQGKFAWVYRGKTQDESSYAFKRLKQTLSAGSHLEKLFDRELQTLSRLSHKRLVRLYGYCVEDGEHVLVYELMEGGTLDQAMRREKNNRRLYFWQRLKIALDIAEGLSYMHSHGVVHRDIKPQNILLTKKLEAKLADFGLLKILDPDNEFEFTAPAGTLGYMDPESISTGSVSKQSDVYSFGVIFLSLLTGRKATITDTRGLNLAKKCKEQGQQMVKSESAPALLQMERTSKESTKQETTEGGGNNKQSETNGGGVVKKEVIKKESNKGGSTKKKGAKSRRNAGMSNKEGTSTRGNRRAHKLMPIGIRRWSLTLLEAGQTKALLDPVLWPLLTTRPPPKTRSSTSLDESQFQELTSEAESPKAVSLRDKRVDKQQLYMPPAVLAALNLALRCCNPVSEDRLLMFEAVQELKSILLTVPAMEAGSSGCSSLTAADINLFLGQLAVPLNSQEPAVLFLGQNGWDGATCIVEKMRAARTQGPGKWGRGKESLGASTLSHRQLLPLFGSHFGLGMLQRAYWVPSYFGGCQLLEFFLYKTGVDLLATGGTQQVQKPADKPAVDSKVFGSQNLRTEAKPESTAKQNSQKEAIGSWVLKKFFSAFPERLKSGMPCILPHSDTQDEEDRRLPRGPMTKAGSSKSKGSGLNSGTSSTFSRKDSTFSRRDSTLSQRSSTLGDATLPSGLSFRSACWVALHVAEALQCLHQSGHVHGAVGPGTVILDTSGRAFLVGHGAKPEDTVHRWLSDELSAWEGNNSRKSAASKVEDIHALGLLMLQIGTGRKSTVDDNKDLALIGSNSEPMPLAEWVEFLLANGSAQHVLQVLGASHEPDKGLYAVSQSYSRPLEENILPVFLELGLLLLESGPGKEITLDEAIERLRFLRAGDGSMFVERH